MEQPEILACLRSYVARELLDGKEMGLDGSTPLLEWGVIDSFSMIAMVNFVNSQFGVTIPEQELKADNFKDLTSVTKLIVGLRKQS